MSRVIFLPLERLHERYTDQMYGWVVEGAVSAGIELLVVEGEAASKTIKHGQWLDTISTTKYKCSQISKLANFIEAGMVSEGDTILFGDCWYPGIEAIKYMTDLLIGKDKVQFGGWHYAGCFDPNDYLAKSLGQWGGRWERHLVRNILDFVVVGCQYHKQLLLDGIGEDVAHKIRPHGLAWEPDSVRRFSVPDLRQNIVVFPHRHAPEKQPDHFRMLAASCAEKFPEWKFVISTSGTADIPISRNVEVVRHKSKREYYEYLATCKIFYSSALQETFGYALHEAIALGLSVVAPRRCSYPEMLQDDERFLYPLSDTIGMMLMEQRLADPIAVPYEYTHQRSHAVNRVFRDIKGKV